MNTISFDNLPEAVSQLQSKLENIERLLEESISQPEMDRWLSLSELCEYIPDKPATSTIYGWVHNRSIPFHKGGKKLRFLKSEIDAWLKTGKRRSVEEIKNGVEELLKTK